jgi:hypothetical protein
MYSCTAVGCFKGTSAPKFQKSETLTQHIKESHEPDTIFSCPVQTCTFEPSKLDDVAVHVHWAHSRDPSEPSQSFLWKSDCKEASGFINAATWNYLRCPIWNCRKFVSGGHKRVSAHLLAHLPIALESVQDKLASDGYEILFGPNEVTLSAGAHYAISVQIRCPACKVRCENDTKLREHIETVHMLSRLPGMLEHFGKWREAILSWTTKLYADQILSCPCWLEPESRQCWLAIRSDFRFGRKARKCSYSTCTFIWEERGCHPSFWRPAEEIAKDLWLHRVEILRHYPQFITHTMFREQHAESESC